MSRIDITKLTATTPLSKLAHGERSGATAAQAGAGDPSANAKGPAQGISVEVGNRIDAGKPPVDGDRVSEIREALKDGSYPIVPTEIADALIAARLMMGYDQ